MSPLHPNHTPPCRRTMSRIATAKPPARASRSPGNCTRFETITVLGKANSFRRGLWTSTRYRDPQQSKLTDPRRALVRELFGRAALTSNFWRSSLSLRLIMYQPGRSGVQGSHFLGIASREPKKNTCEHVSSATMSIECESPGWRARLSKRPYETVGFPDLEAKDDAVVAQKRQSLVDRIDVTTAFDNSGADRAASQADDLPRCVAP